MSGRSSLLDRRALFSSAAAAALLAATGVSAAGMPRRGGRLRMALSGAARSDDWVTGDGLFMQVARQGVIFDTLTEVAADGTLRGELATGWKSAEGGRIWWFDLRQGVTFHDETPFTARDAMASLQLAFGENAGVAELNRRAILVTLAMADPSLPLRLSSPEFVIRPARAPEAGIGTGLYRLRRFTPGRQLLAARIAGHWREGEAGWFDEVELVSIPAAEVRAQALAEGMVDAADLAPGNAIPAATLFPDGSATAARLALPGQTGTAHPMDNLRAAERWWFA
jgi:peptide/nickel transport system substrate-binding protein